MRQDEQVRGTASERGYGAAWRKVRDMYLVKHPWCADIYGDHKGAFVQAKHVDHVVPRAMGGTDEESNLQGLCAHCHSVKTAREDGGFGNAVRGGAVKKFRTSDYKPRVGQACEKLPDRNC